MEKQVENMNQKVYKKIVLSILIAGLTTSSVTSFHTYAAEQSAQTISLQKQEIYIEYSLGPEKFQEVMDTVATSLVIMNSYSQTILEQKEVDFKGVNSLNHDLKTNIHTHQKDAWLNATYWLNEMKPNITQVNQDIVNYSITFQEYYARLLLAINQNDTSTLKTELEKLYNSILVNKKKNDQLLSELISFRDKMSVDTQNFKLDVDAVTSILASFDHGIPLLQQQITQYNDVIKKQKDIIIAGGVLCATLIGCIAGGPMIGIAKKNISDAEQEIQKLNSKITELQTEVVVVTNIKNQMFYLTDTIDVAITSLQNISNQWHTVGAKYNNLLHNIKNISSDDFVFIKEDLNTAKDSWQDLKEYADKIHEGTKKVAKGL